MRICYLGPQKREEMLNGWVSPGVTVEAKTSGGGGATIESVYDECLAAPNTVKRVQEAEAEGFDAVVIGCFGDPGADAAREVVSIPVVAVGEASLTVASLLGVRFGVLTPLEALLPSSLKQVRNLGLEHKLAHIEAVELPITVIREDPKRTKAALVTAAKKCVDKRADTVVLGCGSMSYYSDYLQEELGIPVVNALKVGVRFAELLVGADLSFSKRAFPFPSSLAGGCANACC